MLYVIYAKLFFVIVATISSVLAFKPYYEMEQADNYFKHYVDTYNKPYATDEKEMQRRLEIFKKNLIKINHLNNRSDTVFHVNAFADLTEEEFRATHWGLRDSNRASACRVLNDWNVVRSDAPETFDWRSRNVVSPVKNQNPCGSCWAFSTIGNIESQYALKNGRIQTFSEQQLVDCDTSNGACNGGDMAIAMSTIMQMGGVQSDQDYPYIREKGTCQFDASKAQVKLSSCNSYMLNDENKLKQILYEVGPLAIGVNAADWQRYGSGIFKECHQEAPGHAVLLVGYGSENGQDYWLIKNSWGSQWGESGFIKIPRGVNACHILGSLTASAVLA